MFEDFVSEYMPSTYVPKQLREDLRNKLVHNYSLGDTYSLVEKMPDTINIAIDKLEIGQGVRVEDIKIDGLTLLNAANVTVVSVQTTRVAVEEPKTAAAAAKPAAAAAAKPAAAPAKK